MEMLAATYFPTGSPRQYPVGALERRRAALGCGASLRRSVRYASLPLLARLPLHPLERPGVDRVGLQTESHETKKAPPSDRCEGSSGVRWKSWRRRTLPPGLPGSTIRAARLNCRVRDGNGCSPRANATSKLWAGRTSRRRASLGCGASLRRSSRYASLRLLARLALHPR